jgi:hypothetical protein
MYGRPWCSPASWTVATLGWLRAAAAVASLRNLPWRSLRSPSAHSARNVSTFTATRRTSAWSSAA